MKFLRKDTHIIEGNDKTIDRNNPENAKTAIELALPDGFSEVAKDCWSYFDGTAYLYEYAGRLVVTDESRELTCAGDGTPDSPLGGPRWVCDSWEELEHVLALTYKDLMFSHYEFKLLNKATQTVYMTREYGRSVKEAIRHHNFWEAPGEKIGEKFEVIEVKNIDMTDEYPYKAENLLRKVFAHKEKVLKKLKAKVKDQQDREDLKALIENEASWNFWRLDTICRDKLFEMMK